MAEEAVLKEIDDAIESLERANAKLAPDVLTQSQAHSLVRAYGRVQKLGGFGVAALSARLSDPASIARASGTSIGKAKDAAATGVTLSSSPALDSALRSGKVSLEQAAEIARAEVAAPGSAKELIEVAQKEEFHVLKDQARKVKLEAEQGRDLADRQREARRARHHIDPLGMMHIHLEMQPHVGAPIVARAEVKAQQLARAARQAAGDGVEPEPFERHLVDAYASLLSGAGAKGPSKRPEVTVLVSHSVAKRGWKDVRAGEICKIPGLGPVPPEIAREIASDAFLNGVFFDGKDLRHLKRWTRGIPAEVRAALELGPPPDFDGIRCRDCGRHHKTEFDHVEPHIALGPASTGNLEPRCWPCHQAKTARDRQVDFSCTRTLGTEPSGLARSLSVMNLKIRCLALLIISVTGIVAVASPAAATFPGKNGRIAFTGSAHDDSSPNYEPNDGTDLEIWTVKPDGSGERNVTNDDRSEGGGMWSPDGKKMLTMCDAGSSFSSAICVMRADGTGRRKLTNTYNGHYPSSWSPDGKHILFVRWDDRSSDQDIWKMQADGSHKNKLTEGHGDEREPRWSPDGQRIAFISGGELKLMRADGTHVRPLTDTANQESSPDWSPDGRKLLFLRTRGGYNLDIWVLHVERSREKRLTRDLLGPQHPVWSPNGRKIVYADGGNYDIYVMDRDGSDIRRVTKTLREDLTPYWQPLPL